MLRIFKWLHTPLFKAEARALKNVKQFLQNPHDVYRIEGFLAATKKDLILDDFSVF